MEKHFEFIPAYISPLTDKEHAAIGRVALLWGQIEYIIDDLICLFSGLSWDELTVHPGRLRHVSDKIQFLKDQAAENPPRPLVEKVLDFCELVDNSKSERNQVFHGIWGWRARRRVVFPAARQTRAPSQPFPASKLPWLERQLCRCSRMGADLCDEFYEHKTLNTYSRFIHHPEREGAPDWLREWSERHPLDLKTLDRAAKKGELPRLDTLYPQR